MQEEVLVQNHIEISCTTYSSNGETLAQRAPYSIRRRYVNTTRVQWTRASQGNREGRVGAGGWFVATMARLLCPGSTAPSPNQPSGLSHQTLMQVPANAGRRRIDKCIEKEREREKEKTRQETEEGGGGGIKIVPASK